jgi:hypothetical protein
MIPRTVKQHQHVRGTLDTGTDFHELFKVSQTSVHVSSYWCSIPLGLIRVQ